MYIVYRSMSCNIVVLCPAKTLFIISPKTVVIIHNLQTTTLSSVGVNYVSTLVRWKQGLTDLPLLPLHSSPPLLSPPSIPLYPSSLPPPPPPAIPTSPSFIPDNALNFELLGRINSSPRLSSYRVSLFTSKSLHMIDAARIYKFLGQGFWVTLQCCVTRELEIRFPFINYSLIFNSSFYIIDNMKETHDKLFHSFAKRILIQI